MSDNNKKDSESWSERGKRRRENRTQDGLQKLDEGKYPEIEDKWARGFLARSKTEESFDPKYLTVLRMYCPFIKDEVVDATHSDVWDFATELAEDERTEGTIDDYINKIQALHDHLNDHHNMDMCSVRNINGEDFEKAGSGVEREFLSRAEVDALVEYAGYRRYGFRDRLLVAFLYYTGVRREKAATIKMENINYKQGYGEIINAKGGKDRNIPLFLTLQNMLKSWRDEKRTTVPAPESDFIFVGEGTENITGNHIRSIVHETAEKAGIQESVGKTSDGKTLYRVTPHLLRHSIANHLADDDVPIKEIGSFLGHDSIKTTNKYYIEEQRKIVHEVIRQGYSGIRG